MASAAQNFQSIGGRELRTVAGSQDRPPAGDLAHILRTLGERVAELSSRLSSELDERDPAWPTVAARKTLLATVRRIIATRRERARLFSPVLFGDPAWDILLHLFQAELEQVAISFSTLTARAKIPATTAIRWVSILVDRGMLARRDDPFDARRVFIELQPATSAAMSELLGSRAERAPTEILPTDP